MNDDTEIKRDYYMEEVLDITVDYMNAKAGGTSGEKLSGTN